MYGRLRTVYESSKASKFPRPATTKSIAPVWHNSTAWDVAPNSSFGNIWTSSSLFVFSSTYFSNSSKALCWGCSSFWPWATLITLADFPSPLALLQPTPTNDIAAINIKAVIRFPIFIKNPLSI